MTEECRERHCIYTETREHKTLASSSTGIANTNHFSLMEAKRHLKVDCLFLYTGGEPERCVRSESVGFRYQKTPVKTSCSHIQVCPLSCLMKALSLLLSSSFWKDYISVESDWNECLSEKSSIWFIQHTVHVLYKHLSIRHARFPMFCTHINPSRFHLNAACVVLISDPLILFVCLSVSCPDSLFFHIFLSFLNKKI